MNQWGSQSRALTQQTVLSRVCIGLYTTNCLIKSVPFSITAEAQIERYGICEEYYVQENNVSVISEQGAAGGGGHAPQLSKVGGGGKIWFPTFQSSRFV